MARCDTQAGYRTEARGAGFARLMLRVLCAFALLLVSSVHQMPARAATMAAAVDLSDYALPDGTLPVLCLTAGDDTGNGDAARHRTGCEACRLTAALDLIHPSWDASRPIDYGYRLHWPVVDNLSHAPQPVYRTHQRGPPGTQAFS